MKVFGAAFGGDDRFYFNLSSNVGPASPNRLEDVQLVQFGYFALSQNRAPDNPPELIAAASNVVVGAPYMGAQNDPLTIAIRAHERARGGPQDGHVSVIRGDFQYDAAHTFLVIRLVNNIRVLVGIDFPRIDRHPKCPPQLGASVRRTFGFD
jgi:hypothetical protein